ncbi:hypothetical protein Tco_0706496 [Tanacetum coccineum]|uniref:Uncharacterized protein n=1 Tax=Tanacetum coccineum TaxID=301880 RepID=A0ABQ4Y8F2_9ASTR
MVALKFASSHNMQFWTTAKVQTVNREVQIQALVDKKKVIITETSIRKDLQPADENGTECLPNATIFAELERMGQGKDFSDRDTTLFQTMMVQSQEEGEGYDSQPSGPTEPMADETENVKSVPTHSNDPLLSGKDRLKLNELMELGTTLSQRVHDLENTKTSQAIEITKLKERVKKLERRNKSRTPGIKRLRKVSRTTRIDSSEDKGLGDQKDASKQGRKIADIDTDEEQEVEVEKVVSTAEVTTTSAITTTVYELTLAQTLIEIKAAKPKAKDKGKAKMVEPEKPLKKKDQILINEEIAQILQEELQAELEEEERLARQKEEDANIPEWDNVQAIINADYELAARLQAQEQEELTIDKRSNMFVELIDKRKKHFARLRAKEQRTK